MELDRKRMTESLKVLDQNPKKIKAQEDLYRQRLAEIKEKEKSGDWTPNALEQERRKALEERDRVSHALARAMRPALEYVQANNDYTALPIDLDNAKLQRALNMIGLMGKNLSYSDQVGLLDQFRGDPASLRVMEAAFTKNGQDWAAQTAQEMQKPISSQALSEMSEVLDFHDYAESQNRFDFPADRMYWTQGSFRKQADKLALDLDEVADPFTLALDMTLDRLNEEEMTMTEADPVKAAQARARIAAKKYKIALAKNDISKAAESGEDPAAIFNKGMIAAEDAAGQIASQNAGDNA